MRVLVCGGRDYDNVDRVYAILDEIGPSTVISGCARGADSIALMWADERNIDAAPFPADWSDHGKRAGPIRNQQMIDQGKPDLVVAFPGGRGTADMVRRANKAGVPVRKID